MKILQINSFFSVGGPPRIVNGIYDVLKENGHECKIAAAREKLYAPDDSIQIGNSYDTYINALKTRIFDDEGLSAKRATRELIQNIEQYNPDIIHLHNLHGYYINIESLFDYIKAADKPVVWTLHDCWAFTGHCAHFDLIKCEKWKNECYQCPQKTEYPSSCLMNRAKRNYDHKKAAFQGVNKLTIVTPSQWLADLVKQSYLGCYPVKVIYNGIDLNTFRPMTSDLPERYHIQGKKIILGVAQNWAEKKGFEDFIQLSQLLDDTYAVVMIGLTEDLINKLPKSVIGINRTTNVEELVKWYSCAHAFVNMTYQDTFPTVNIEALACGTPVVTYNTGGSPEAIDHTSGLTIEQGDINGIKDAIAELSKKSHQEQQCINRSRQFDRTQKYLEYIELYRSLTGENS